MSWLELNAVFLLGGVKVKLFNLDVIFSLILFLSGDDGCDFWIDIDCVDDCEEGLKNGKDFMNFGTALGLEVQASPGTNICHS